MLSESETSQRRFFANAQNDNKNVMLSGAKHLRDSSGLSSLRMTEKENCHASE